MIDYHCHLLPGIDDGPKNIDESIAMADALQKAGFKKIYCTPHLMKGHFDAGNQAVLKAVEHLQQRLDEEKIRVKILPGREYYLDEFLGKYLKHPMPLGNTKYIMLEIPNYADENFIREACFRIKCMSYTPMIAHPERCRIFALSVRKKKSILGLGITKSKDSSAKPKQAGLLAYLQEIGCAFQGDIGSLDGLYGKAVQETAKCLKAKKVFTHFGTDAHSLKGITDYLAKHKLVKHPSV